MAIRWWKGKAAMALERRGWEEGSQMRLVVKVLKKQATISLNPKPSVWEQHPKSFATMPWFAHSQVIMLDLDFGFSIKMFFHLQSFAVW
nr:hypothetical protein Iba_chr12aCG23060 [Ipomoea batatas]